MDLTQRGEFWMAGAAVSFATANFFDQIAMVKADPFVAATVKAILVSSFSFLMISTMVNFNEKHEKGLKHWLKVISVYAPAGLISEVIGTVAFFQAMKLGGINIAVPTAQTWLIWAAIGGAIFLHERARLNTFLGLALSVIGLILLTRFQQYGQPFTPKWIKAIPFGLIGAFGWAGSTVLIRKGQTEGIDRYEGLFIQFTTALLGLIIVMIHTKRVDLLFHTSIRTYGYMIISASLAGILGMVCMYKALEIAPVEQVIPIMAFYPILSAVAGVLLLGDYLNLGMSMGIILTTSGVAICKGKSITSLGRRN